MQHLITLSFLGPIFPEIPSTFSPSKRMDQFFILTNKRKLRFCIFHYLFIWQRIHEPYQLSSLSHTAWKIEIKASGRKDTYIVKCSGICIYSVGWRF